MPNLIMYSNCKVEDPEKSNGEIDSFQRTDFYRQNGFMLRLFPCA